jgi:hypothetical protein
MAAVKDLGLSSAGVVLPSSNWLVKLVLLVPSAADFLTHGPRRSRSLTPHSGGRRPELLWYDDVRLR